MDDRTRVVLIDFGMSLPFAGLLLPWLLTHGRDELDSRSVLVGSLSGFAIGYVSEHDPIAPKLEHYRNRLVQSTVLHCYQRLLFRSLQSKESIPIGYLVGIVSYRLVFGVIRPVPEGRLRRASLLDWLRRSDGPSSD